MKKNKLQIHMTIKIIYTIFIYCFFSLSHAEENAIIRNPDIEKFQIYEKIRNYIQRSREWSFEGEFIHQKLNNPIMSYHVINKNDGVNFIKSINKTNISEPKKNAKNQITVNNKELNTLLINNTVYSHIPQNITKKILKSYDISNKKLSLIAGRKTESILIKPKDKYRNGYHFWFDSQTGIILKSETFHPQTLAILEKIEFIQIKLFKNNNLDKNTIESSFKNNKTEEYHITKSKDFKWNPNWLPNNFTLIHKSKSYCQKDASKLINIGFYSDGISSFSIFSETINKNKRFKDLNITEGANVIVGRSLLSKDVNYHVLIIGSIPIETAERISLSIQSP